MNGRLPVEYPGACCRSERQVFFRAIHPRVGYAICGRSVSIAITRELDGAAAGLMFFRSTGSLPVVRAQHVVWRHQSSTR